MTYYLNSSCIRKSITLMFMSSSRNKFTLLYQNSITDVFVGFRPPCWGPSRWAPAWCLHANLYNLGKTFLRISRIRNILLTWILARVFVYLPPFISQISDYICWTVLIFIWFPIKHLWSICPPYLSLLSSSAFRISPRLSSSTTAWNWSKA